MIHIRECAEEFGSQGIRGVGDTEINTALDIAKEMFDGIPVGHTWIRGE